MSIASSIDKAGYRSGAWLLERRGFQRRYLHTPYGLIHAFELAGHGDGPAVLMLHGISSDGLSFSRVMRRLRSRHRRIVALEALGHGASENPDQLDTTRLLHALTAAIDELRFEVPPILFGNSMGGGMALWYATEYPDRVSGLVLASPAGAHITDEQMSGLLDSLELTTLDDSWKFVQRLLYRASWAAWPLSFLIRARFKRRAVRALLRTAHDAPMMTRERLARLRVPVHVVWGVGDGVLPRDCADYYEENLPEHAVFEHLDGVGHSPHLEAPGALVQRIGAVADRLAS